MKKFWKLAALLACLTATTLWADEYTKKTKVTFNRPVQIPSPHSSVGVVTLPAGTYIFKLQNSSSNRNIVTVSNLKEDQVISTILAISDYRINATSKTVMYFSEAKAGAPMPIKSWFYPGDNNGQRFVYPKLKAQEIAAQINAPVPSHTAAEIDTTVKLTQVPVAIQTPTKTEVAYTPATLAPADAKDTAGEDGEAVLVAQATPPPARANTPAAAQAERPRTLPTTASNLPLFGLLGFVLLLASLALRRVARSL